MISSLLETISGYTVLIIGDSIIDEYVYVRPQGKSPKENIITNRILRSERFMGGVWAAAKHVESFCKRVDVYTGNKAIVKRRFVEATYMQKLFEVHDEEVLPVILPEHADRYDLVIVTDFGHGFVGPELIEELTRKARFLAVNAQTNSTNVGFNLITKYPRADYVVVDELEARLAAHDRDSPLERVIDTLAYERIVVTRGPHGSLGYDHGEYVKAEAVSSKVVDTMGAGDAFFCVTAPFARARADMETLCKIGNAAGAIKCSVVGHRQPVTRKALCAALEVGNVLEGVPVPAP